MSYLCGQGGDGLTGRRHVDGVATLGVWSLEEKPWVTAPHGRAERDLARRDGGRILEGQRESGGPARRVGAASTLALDDGVMI